MSPHFPIKLPIKIILRKSKRAMLLEVQVPQVFRLESENPSPFPTVGSPSRLFKSELFNISPWTIFSSSPWTPLLLLLGEHVVHSRQVRLTAGTVLVIELLHFGLEFRTCQFFHFEIGP